MEPRFHKATLEDLDLLVQTRVKVLLAANRLPEDTDMSAVGQASRDYYTAALADGSHAAWLVFDGDTWIGAGGVSFYRVMPTYHNPSGWKAYLMNIYTTRTTAAGVWGGRWRSCWWRKLGSEASSPSPWTPPLWGCRCMNPWASSICPWRWNCPTHRETGLPRGSPVGFYRFIPTVRMTSST